jgi:hypothetical protein
MPFDHGWASFNHGLASFNHGVASFNHGLAQFNHPRPPEQQRAVAVIPVTSGRIYHQGAKRPREDPQGGKISPQRHQGHEGQMRDEG